MLSGKREKHKGGKTRAPRVRGRVAPGGGKHKNPDKLRGKE